MADKNKNTLQVQVNGWTVKECADRARARIDTASKSAFNIGVICAYACGVTIPAFGEVGEAICPEPMKNQKDFTKLVDRSEALISRWIGAIKLIIENNDFVEFASGLYPFQVDKIFIIYKNLDTLKDYEKADLFRLSKSSLNALVAKADTAAADEDTATDEESTNMVQFTYNDTVYTVSEKALLGFIAANCEVVNQ